MRSNNFSNFSPRELCPRIGERIAGVADSSARLTASEKSHIESCLYCQAEVIRYRKLLRALHDLRVQVVSPSPGLLVRILDEIGTRAEKRTVGSIVNDRRVAYGGGIAVVTLAGVTGAVLIAGRHRRSVWKRAS